MRSALLLLAMFAGCTSIPQGALEYPHKRRPPPKEALPYGDGYKAGCWIIRGDHEAYLESEAEVLPLCEQFAEENSKRIVLEVVPPGAMGEHTRGIAWYSFTYLAWSVTLSEQSFQEGTWRNLWKHEACHVNGLLHAYREPFGMPELCGD